jgi:hypothetical protein
MGFTCGDPGTWVITCGRPSTALWKSFGQTDAAILCPLSELLREGSALSSAGIRQALCVSEAMHALQAQQIPQHTR